MLLSRSPFPSATGREGKKVLLIALSFELSALNLDADGELDKEGRAFGLVVSHPDISIVIGDDGVDDGQP